MSAIEVKDVHRVYRGGRRALSGVTFSVEEGEVVGLLGTNGAGKTTLINILMGMLRPQQGTVSVLGLDPERSPVELKRRVGFVSEDQVLPSAMTVASVIQFHRKLFPTWDDRFERELRGRFQFDEKSKVGTLSKGQARQLALLCAVAHRPELLVLDEPAGSLDPAMRRGFLETSIQLLAESGTTILFSSHHMGDVERIAGRAVMIADGRVLVDADLDTLREGYALLVTPADNGVRGQLSGDPRCVHVRRHRNTVHAVFRGSATDVAAVAREELGLQDSSCRHVPLEELFVELVGTDS